MCVCCSVASSEQDGEMRKVEDGGAGLASCFGSLSTAFLLGTLVSPLLR